MQIFPTLDLEAALPVRRVIVEIEVVDEETLAFLYEACDREIPLMVMDHWGRPAVFQVLKITPEAEKLRS